MSAQGVQPTPSSDGPIEQVEHAAASYLSNPADRAALISDIKAATAGKPRWVRAATGLLLLASGAWAFAKGAPVLDGASMAVGLALMGAGASELATL